MSKRQWLCIIGVWIALFLYLGFPVEWHKIILVITGLIVISIAYNLPQENLEISTNKDSAFVENNKKDN